MNTTASSLFDGLDITAKWADGHHPFCDIALMDQLLDRGTHAELVQWMLWNDPTSKVDQANVNAVRDEVESQIAYAKREHAADLKSAEYAHTEDRYRGDWE